MVEGSSFGWSGPFGDRCAARPQFAALEIRDAPRLSNASESQPMTDHRTSRLNEQFKREISSILTRKVRDPRVGKVLITEARVTSDLWMARVFFRLLEGDRSEAEVLEGLQAAAPFIRKELGKVLRIRRIPELRFQFDSTLDSAARIEEVLREVLPSEGGSRKSGHPLPEVEEPADEEASSEDSE